MDVSDSELMSRLAAGDDLALNMIMTRWSARVSSFLFRMTGQHDTAVDLAQETFVKLYQASRRYRPQACFSTWLFAIAANLARNHARWKRRHPTVSIDDDTCGGPDRLTKAADEGNTPGEALQSRETAAAVNQAVLELPQELREALTLFVYEGMGHAEIAKLAGCSTKAVETRIYRARRILKEKLKDLKS